MLPKKDVKVGDIGYIYWATTDMFGKVGEQQTTNVYVWETDEDIILSEIKAITEENQKFIKDINDLADAHKDDEDFFSKVLGVGAGVMRMQDICKPMDMVAWKTKIIKVGSTQEIILVELIERIA